MRKIKKLTCLNSKANSLQSLGAMVKKACSPWSLQMVFLGRQVVADLKKNTHTEECKKDKRIDSIQTNERKKVLSKI